MKTFNTLKKELLQGINITVPVLNSTNISTWSYNPKKQTLSILFKKGTLYRYNNVGVDVPYKFLETQMNGASFGREFRAIVLDKYKYTRLDSMGDVVYTRG